MICKHNFHFVFLLLSFIIGAWCSKLPLQKYLDNIPIGRQPRPPTPVWPTQFTSDFYVFVEKYGEDFHPKGALYYDWTIRTFRSDFFDWCLPLFDSGPGKFNNYTCSYLATGNNMYFINHTADTWSNYDCCLFQKDLGAVPPDWMKTAMYNGTDVIGNVPVDVWWFPGSVSKGSCFAYWSARDKSQCPIQFFGITALKQTVLEYFNFKARPIPSNINFTKPNDGCDKECIPPSVHVMSMPLSYNTAGNDDFPIWPKWPICMD